MYGVVEGLMPEQEGRSDKKGGWGHINEKDFAASQFCLTLFSVTRMVRGTWYYFCQNCRVLYKMMWEGKITFRIENILILF